MQGFILQLVTLIHQRLLSPNMFELNPKSE